MLLKIQVVIYKRSNATEGPIHSGPERNRFHRREKSSVPRPKGESTDAIVEHQRKRADFATGLDKIGTSEEAGRG